LNTTARTMKTFMIGLFGVGVLGILASQYVLDPVRNQSDPQRVARNFVHYIETDQLNKANELSSSTLRDKPQWMSILREINQNIEPNAVVFKTLEQTDENAKIQFYSQPPIVLYLKKENGKWAVFEPNNQ
jgi:hypothetical protein